MFRLTTNLTVCGNTMTVTIMNDSGTGSLRDALTNVCGNGTINFNGNYTIAPASPLTTSNTTTIDGTGRTVTIGGTFEFATNGALTGPLTVNNLQIDSGRTLTANSGSSLNVTGNWTNNGGTFNGGTSTVTFNGSGAQTIGGTAATTFNGLTINNTGSGVSLRQNATVNGALTLTSALTTATKVLNLGSSATVSGAGDVIGTVRRTSPATGAPLAFNNQYTTMTFTTAPTQMDVQLIRSAPAGLTTAVQRYYTLTPTGSANATIQLAYRATELGGTTEANEALWRYDTGQSRWVLQGGTVNTTNHFVSLPGVSQFSDWAISNNGAPTAVTLSSFQATAPSFDLWRWLTQFLER